MEWKPVACVSNKNIDNRIYFQIKGIHSFALL